MHSTLLQLVKFKKNVRINLLTRTINKYFHSDVSGKVIRNRFLDCFVKENGHKFVKSSPVVPFCDPTVNFVNAGMNQFKGIFLGTQTPKYGKVANSQKCIRVSGKHNDLNVIGTDGYHHTFFEMLGNWSFGEYFKEDACKMAWTLLTDIYKIPPSKLYVTYFSGDAKLGLKEDAETREVWRKIGVPEDRILPFGIKDNFWEMGISGPCGPCTEIHADLTNAQNRVQFVNRGLNDLTEIWNIVFIQYNRNIDGTISQLPKKHVDTGMGFERLTSLLQGQISNYDTDNFTYLLSAINKNCSNLPKYSGKFGEYDQNGIDTSYRILADHTRMTAVALADGMIPEQNQKLRKVMRKAFLLSENVFKKDKGLVKELTNYVAENLGQVYPEISKNISQVQQIIDYEEEIYKSIRKSAEKDWQKLTRQHPNLLEIDLVEIGPSFIKAYKEICDKNLTKIDGPLAYRLYDTHGLDDEVISKLAENLKIKFDPNDFEDEFKRVKLKSKKGSEVSENNNVIIALNKVQETDDSFKYSYKKISAGYVFDSVDVNVLQIIKDAEIIDETPSDSYVAIVLSKTNLYAEAGGQSSDKGTIEFENGSFAVENLEKINNRILHKGFFKGGTLKKGSKGTLRVNENVRLKNMQNHTGTHLLNTTLKKIKKATCQKSSKVTDSSLTFDVAVFGSKLTLEEAKEAEDEINNLIRSRLQVKVREADSRELYELDDVTLIPGEVYPENGIRLIEVVDAKGVCYSREPCCGTHVFNTADIENFCIVGFKSLGRSTSSISAVTGDRAKLAKSNAEELEDEIVALQKTYRETIDKPEILDMAIAALRYKTKYDVDDDSILPVYKKRELLQKLDSISKEVKETSKETLKDFIEMEMQNALESNIKKTPNNKNYMIHYLRSSMILESVPLQRATKLCPNVPILVISYSDSLVKARCCVPKGFVTDTFNAEKWLKQTVAKVFKSRAAPPKGQDASFVCNMKEKKVHLQEWDPLLTESLEEAEKFVKDNL